jgi:RimJ/RimL family protein N-acetyltransferase
MMEYINLLSKEQTFINYQGEVITLEEEKKYLTKQLERMTNHETVQLLVFSGEKLIGISGVDMGNRVEKHVGVFGLSIAKEFRGEGIGTTLMKHVLKEAEENIPQLKIIILGVFSNNPLAKSLYEKIGFIEYGNLPGGILHRDVYVDHVYMYKVIRSN